ncbi:MAG: DUF1963 domain-containing protein [Candidatus Cloacimonetes bacterium]|nr:DUF1963 domain-containing protein [Candidatus Cloacimonadota bacterium]
MVREKKKARRNWKKLLAPLTKTAFRLSTAEEPTTSYFGSLPPAYEGFSWPVNTDDDPLSFLACIDCRGISAYPGMEWLPQTGRLLFFYDTLNQPWGFDPSHKDGFSVIYVPESSIENDGHLARPPADFPDGFILTQTYLNLRFFMDVPSVRSPLIAHLNLNDEEMEDYEEYRVSMFPGFGILKAMHKDRTEPWFVDEFVLHQIGGYPAPVQGDNMDVKCQVVSNGISLAREFSEEEERRLDELEKGAGDWSLLFQMDSDVNRDLMWCDEGRLYFWIRRQDAMDQRFDLAWTILQTY